MIYDTSHLLAGYYLDRMSVLGGHTKRKLDEVEDEDRRLTRLRHRSYASSTDRSPLPNGITLQKAPSYSTGIGPRQSGPFTTVGNAQPVYDSLSEPPSRRPSPTSYDTPFRTPRIFESNASVVLIGIRGTGKSSLAVILSAATGRRLIHADRYFEQAAGRPRAEFKKEHGTFKYRQQEARVMESMLMENKKGCVIDCGPWSMEPSGQALLREYAKSHPVVHILRDPASVQAYIKTWDAEKVHRFLTLSGPLYRACSNLEFFNVSEVESTRHACEHSGQDSLFDASVDELSRNSTPFLTLKRVERDFLQFMAHSAGSTMDLSKPLDSFPLSPLAIESRNFTYAVSVQLSTMFERDLDVEDLESTADAFELQLDVLQDPPDGNSEIEPELADRISQTVATIRRSIIVPLIYHTAQVRQANGLTRRSDTAYLGLVEHGLRLAPDFLTVDLSYTDKVIAQIIGSKGRTRIIGFSDFLPPNANGWDDPQYMAIYERAMNLGCDLVRFSHSAATIEENFAVQRFQHKVQTLPDRHAPLIAYNSGSLGRLSCCFNQILTPVTHPSLVSDSRESLSDALPCITVREAQQALFASFALDPMRFYVFGAHVTYSLSPAMHNAAFKACGMPHVYNTYQSPSIRGLNELIKDHHFGGSSLALPYKTEVIPLLDSMSSHARAIGAVNTLIPIRTIPADGTITSDTVFHERSRAGSIKALYGENTDWVGIHHCVRRGLSPANAVRSSSTGLVIGAGGMARAAVYAIIQMGVQNIFIYNRTVSNAEELAHHYNRQNLGGSWANTRVGRVAVHVMESLSDPWPANYKQPSMVISCIPEHSIGGQPAPNFKLPKHWLESPTGGVVLEVRVSNDPSSN